MRSHKTFLLSFTLTIFAAAAQAQSADPESVAVPLTDPSQPVSLRGSLVNGSITVEGYDGSEVLVEASERPGNEKSEHREGMMRIPNTGFGLTISEKANKVTVSADWSRRPIDLVIRVPRRTSVRLSSTTNGELSIQGVTGEHELSNTNGAIYALEVSGSVVASTTNGRVEVSFVDLQMDKPMSFTTWSGDVDVTLPEGLRADLKLESGRGNVYSDFDVDLKPMATRVQREGGDGAFRVRLERAVEGTIGGGGAQFHFKTFNGDIFLRRVGGSG